MVMGLGVLQLLYGIPDITTVLDGFSSASVLTQMLSEPTTANNLDEKGVKPVRLFFKSKIHLIFKGLPFLAPSLAPKSPVWGSDTVGRSENFTQNMYLSSH